MADARSLLRAAKAGRVARTSAQQPQPAKQPPRTADAGSDPEGGASVEPDTPTETHLTPTEAMTTTMVTAKRKPSLNSPPAQELPPLAKRARTGSDVDDGGGSPPQSRSNAPDFSAELAAFEAEVFAPAASPKADQGDSYYARTAQATIEMAPQLVGDVRASEPKPEEKGQEQAEARAAAERVRGERLEVYERDEEEMRVQAEGRQRYVRPVLLLMSVLTRFNAQGAGAARPTGNNQKAARARCMI